MALSQINNSDSGSSVRATLNSAIGLINAGVDPLAVSLARNAPWDDFDAADSTPLVGRITPSGHAWNVTGAGAATAIINKQGYSNTALSYAYLIDSQVINEFECVVSWTAVSGQVGVQGTNGTIAFTSDTSNPVSGTSKLLHLQLSSETWNLLKSTSGPAGLTTLSGTPVELNSVPATLGNYYGTNLKIDGTRYKFRLVTSGNTLTIYFPDGIVWQWTDTDISTIMSSVTAAFLEHSGNGVTGFADLRFHGCAMGPSKAGSVIEAATNKDTAILRGLFAITGATAGNGGYSPRLTSPQIIPLTANGWYTIATQSADTAAVKMAGIVTVWGNDTAGRKTFIKIHIGTEKGIDPPYYTFMCEGFLGNYGGGVIDFVRLSQDDTNSLIQFDIHINAAGASGATLHANYEGFFTVTATPVVGATVLPTWNKVAANPAFYSYQPQFGMVGNVADLPPAADAQGCRGFVLNSNATLAAGIGNTVAGGGTNKVPVYCDGTNWLIG